MDIVEPADWKGREVDTIDALLHVKQQVDMGRPLWLFTGASTLQSLVAWAHGCAASRRYNRQPDRFPAFIVWLRDVKRDMPPDWVHLYLRQHVDDHHAAIHHFLSHVAEFATENPPAHP